MKLICNNPKYIEFPGPDGVSFWEIPVPSDVFGLSGGAGAELDALSNDHVRLREQSDRLAKLMPAQADQIQQQFAATVDELSLKVKKILGNKVKLVP